jgi:hypothetical protein
MKTINDRTFEITCFISADETRTDNVFKSVHYYDSNCFRAACNFYSLCIAKLLDIKAIVNDLFPAPHNIKRSYRIVFTRNNVIIDGCSFS